MKTVRKLMCEKVIILFSTHQQMERAYILTIGSLLFIEVSAENEQSLDVVSIMTD